MISLHNRSDCINGNPGLLLKKSFASCHSYGTLKGVRVVAEDVPFYLPRVKLFAALHMLSTEIIHLFITWDPRSPKNRKAKITLVTIDRLQSALLDKLALCTPYVEQMCR